MSVNDNPGQPIARVPGRSLSGRALLNGIAALLDYGTRLVVGFVVNPYLVAGLGDYGYGVWQMLGRLIGYIAPAGGRPTQALKWTIANRQASTDFDEKRRQVGSAIVVWLFLAPVVVTLGAILTWFVPISLGAPAASFASIRLATGLLVANLLLVGLVNLPKSVLEGENLGFRRMGLSSALVVAGGGSTLLALYLDLGIAGVAAATLLTTGLTGALFLPIARRYVPWFGVRRPPLREVRRFLGLSGWFLGWKFVMQLLRSGDILVLGFLASVDLVTTYTLTKYVPETLISFVAIVVFGITPGLGGIIGSGDLKRAGRVRSEIMALTWLIVSVLGTTVLLWNRSFVPLWVGDQHFAGDLQSLLIVLMITQFVFVRNDANVIDLTLKLRAKVLLGVAAASLSVLTAAVLLRALDMGIAGVSLGFICGNAVLSVAYPRLTGRYLGVVPGDQLRGIVRPALMTIALYGAALWLSRQLVAGSWLDLSLFVVATLPLVAVLALYGGLPRRRRQQLLRRARAILDKKGAA